MFTKDRDFYKTFLRLAVTLMLEQAVILSVNLADNLMLGTYSEAALSGVAAVNQIQFVFQQLVYAVNNAMIVLGSQYFGQKRMGEVKKLSAIGVRAELLISLVLFCLVSFFPQQALHMFTDDAAIAADGVKYLNIIRFSYVFFALTAVMLGTMRIAQSVKIALKVSIVALVVNVTLNYLLISGNFGFPEMGAEGAAVGTLVSRIVEFLLVLWYVFKKEKNLEIKPKDYAHLDRQLLKDYIKVGVPVFITAGLWGISNALQTVILGHLSANAIAAQSISSTFFLLLKVTSVGAASASSLIIGQTVGAGNMGKIKEYTKTLQFMYLGIGLVLASIMFIARIPLLNIYEISDETRYLANAYMLIQSVVLFTMSYQMPVNTGIIRGGGDTRFTMIMDLISIWGIVVPVSLLAAFVWDLSPIIVIICLNADQCFKCIPACIRVNSYKWIKKLTRKAETESETGSAAAK